MSAEHVDMRHVSDRWQDVDLPVLVATARLLRQKEGGWVRDDEVVEALSPLNLAEAAVKLSLADLSQTYLEGRVQRFAQAVPPLVSIRNLTDEGRRAVGQWPSDDATKALLAALTRAADQVPDEQEAGKVRRLVSGFGSLSRETLVQVTAAAAAALATGR